MESQSDPADGLQPVVDGLTFVRQHPEMFRQLAHDGPAAAALLVEGALRNSSQSLEIRRVDDWYIVLADVDWLSGLGTQDPFTEIVPFPGLGPNAIHPEVIVTAYSTALTTIAGGAMRQLVGAAPDPSLGISADIVADGRAVIFQMESWARAHRDIET